MTGCIWTSTYCFFVVFIVVSFFSLINPPDEGLSLRSYPPFQGWCAPAQFVKPVHQQRKRFLSCMPAAVDELHSGDVGLAAKAAAIRGSRPYGLSPPLRGDRGPLGLSPHTNQLWIVITTLSCAVGTNKSAPAGAFVLLRRAMPGRLLGGFALLCFRAQITLPLRRFQTRQQDSAS